jgi:hypothetical protein
MTGQSRERGIKGHVHEWRAGLCRESPFTALSSKATFAVTDDHQHTTRHLKNNQPSVLQLKN